MKAYCVFYWDGMSSVNDSYHLTEQGAIDAVAFLVSEGLDAEYDEIEIKEK